MSNSNQLATLNFHPLMFRVIITKLIFIIKMSKDSEQNASTFTYLLSHLVLILLHCQKHG